MIPAARIVRSILIVKNATKRTHLYSDKLVPKKIKGIMKPGRSIKVTGWSISDYHNAESVLTKHGYHVTMVRTRGSKKPDTWHPGPSTRLHVY